MSCSYFFILLLSGLADTGGIFELHVILMFKLSFLDNILLISLFAMLLEVDFHSSGFAPATFGSTLLVAFFIVNTFELFLFG